MPAQRAEATTFFAASGRSEAAINASPGIVALYGPILDVTSTGELAMTKMTVLYAVLVSAMILFVVRRHTRGDEEAGRSELEAAVERGEEDAVTQRDTGHGRHRSHRPVRACSPGGVAARLVLMPESEGFRAIYPPLTTERLYAVLRRLEAEYAAPLVDARDWLPTDAFTDGHNSERSISAHCCHIARSTKRCRDQGEDRVQLAI